MKRTADLIVCVLFCALFLFGTAGCETEIKLPDHLAGTEGKALEIGMWVGVPGAIGGNTVSDEEFLGFYRDIKESGINIAHPGLGWHSGTYILRALNAAKEVGIKQLIQDLGLNNLLLDRTKTDEQILSQASEMTAYYKDHEAFYGNLVWDEPQFGDFDLLARAYRLYQRIMPGKLFHVNLLPAISGVSVLGAKYEDYISAYAEKVGTPYISYDHYPLTADGFGNTQTDETFLYNMEVVRSSAGSGTELWTFLQSIAYGANHRGPKSKGDIGWQAYSFLAYGGKCIQWFCYWSPGFDGATNFGEGMIGRNGKRTPVYDYVKAVNLEMRAFEQIYLDFNWQGVMPVVGVDNPKGYNPAFEYLESPLKTHPRIKGVKASEDIIIGAFENGADNAFVIVNYADPGTNKKSNIEIDFNGAKSAVIYREGEQSGVRLKDGKFSAELDSGEGIFLIPLK